MVRGHEYRPDGQLVGGSRQCVEAILASPELEAFEVSTEMSVQWDSDTINLDRNASEPGRHSVSRSDATGVTPDPLFSATTTGTPIHAVDLCAQCAGSVRASVVGGWLFRVGAG